MIRECVFDGCDKPPANQKHGLCWQHYTRLRRWGDPAIASDPSRRASTVEERLIARLDRSGGPDACWPWIGKTRLPKGYGFMSVDGRRTLTHRIAYALANGPIPDGKYVLHHCDNPPCCNPRHLFIGTHAENLADAAAKDRMRGWQRPHGEGHPRARLDAEKVRDIRRLARSGVYLKDIARQYCVGPTTVRNVVIGRTWAHVD